jgi:hypothetical protein
MKVNTSPSQRICQGDIFRDIEYFESVSEISGTMEVRKILFPQAVVLTQDCDLAQDHTFRIETKETQDKWLISVLLAPLYNAEHFFAGEHLQDIGVRSQLINKTKRDGQLLMQNQTPRYHYLEFPRDVPLIPSVIDFKHYFSAPIPYLTELKPTHFVCTIGELYREDISQRFAAFLSRIGLPAQEALVS